MKPFLIFLLVSTTLSGCASIKKSSDKTETKTDENKLPPLTDAVVKKIWVKSKIQGNEFHEGHWMYLIEKNVKWSE